MAFIIFAIVSGLIGYVLLSIVGGSVSWHPYLVWLAVLNPTTFVMYGLDKALSKMRVIRVPNALLHLLALLGGFAGGWLGRMVFNHKSNRKRYPAYPVILTLSTLVHGAAFWYCLSLVG